MSSGGGDVPPGAVPLSNDKEGSGTPQNRRNRNFRRTGGVASAMKEPKFEGRLDALNGHIYDCSYRQADMYNKTTKEIAMYVGRTYKFGNDAKLAIEHLGIPMFDKPPNPEEDAGRSDIRIWEKEIDDYVKRKNTFKENMKSAFSVVWGRNAAMQ